MEDETFGDLGGNPIPDHLRDEHETVLTPAPDGLPSPVETALAQYADSIERLSADWASEVDPYTPRIRRGVTRRHEGRGEREEELGASLEAVNHFC